MEASPLRPPSTRGEPPSGGGGLAPLAPFALGALGLLSGWGALYILRLKPAGVGKGAVFGSLAGVVLVSGGLFVTPPARDAIEAQLDPPKLQTVIVKASVDVPVARSDTAEAKCPTGYEVVSGGFDTTWNNTDGKPPCERTGRGCDPSRNSAQEMSVPTYYRVADIEFRHNIGPRVSERPLSGAAGWSASASNPPGNLDPFTLTTFALCARSATPTADGVDGVRIIKSGPTTVARNGSGIHFLNCEADKVILGAGADAAPGFLATKTPKARQWAAHLVSTQNEGGPFRMEAVCAAGVPEIASGDSDFGTLLTMTHAAAPTTIDAGKIGVVALSCPSGTKILGGGHAAIESDGIIRYGVVVASYPTSKGWAWEVYNAFDFPASDKQMKVTPYAICGWLKA